MNDDSRWAGFNTDLDLNWNDYGARWYDPAIGRWNAVDPISDQFTHLSVFNYASNNPVVNIDLHGLQGIRFDGTYSDPGIQAYLRKKQRSTLTKEEHKLYTEPSVVAGSVLTAVSPADELTLLGYFANKVPGVSRSVGVVSKYVDEAMDRLKSWWKKPSSLNEFNDVAIPENEMRKLFGGGRYSIYGPIENAGSNLVYIGTKNGLPYIGKTWNQITSRYKDPKKAPLPFTDWIKVPRELLEDVEATLIKFNGGPKSGNISNKINSRGRVTKESVEWLDKNIINWKTRFNFR